MRQDQESWTRGYLDALFGTPFNAKDLDRYSYSAGRVEGEVVLEAQRKADAAGIERLSIKGDCTCTSSQCA